MKFMVHVVPTVPASPIERERLRPIAHRTEKIQQMLDEMIQLAACRRYRLRCCYLF
jgi:hypothetical protein